MEKFCKILSISSSTTTIMRLLQNEGISQHSPPLYTMNSIPKAKDIEIHQEQIG